MYLLPYKPVKKPAWNKGKLLGQKPPLKPNEIWAIRTRLQIQTRIRDLAMFNLAIDSKLRACDLVKIKVSDLMQGSTMLNRAKVVQQKTKQPVQFEITKNTKETVLDWIDTAELDYYDYLFPSRVRIGNHIHTRSYYRLVKIWVALIGLNPSCYGTHSMRRTKASIIYKKTKNIRAVQLLLGHSKLESTVRYLGIEVDDALELAEQIEI
tara:strand:+ start:33594 stop:34220 length:627 start_codon:yes stop_codon:yes gene_type:complete